MLPQKIKALFDFIDFLDAHKTEFIEKHLPLCRELEILDKKRSLLKPDINYKDKLPRNTWSGLPERPGQISAEHISMLPRNV